MRRSKLVINCQPGISPVLKNEIESLGYRVLSVDNTGVSMEGGWEEVMDLNFNLRTASRVLWTIRSFEAKNPNELYAEAKKTPWNKLIPKDGFISIHSFVKNDYIRDTSFANLKLKDAIVDQMTETTGDRPNSGKEKDKTVIFMFWYESKCTIYFDTSGETIAKHGYRKMPFKAPMMESLAAACVRSSVWKPGKDHFINPMCGSGTLAIEAALLATNRPPGLLRDNYGFMHIDGYDPEVWKAQKSKLRINSKIDGKIIASDLSGLAVNAAIENAKNADVSDLIEFEKAPFEKTNIPEGSGIVMINPEYGDRLGEIEELEKIYEQLGDFFKQKCQGKMGYIFTGNSNLAKRIGLRTKSKTQFFNARIECRLLEYELYGGSRKAEGNHKT
ncbi:class I SAM-dependent RNA methyltransferase [Reichenbachiella sp. MALMAid0571]|uniref:THUMP domain-containing class I SAM-dependent RNA methyltransferase n=1 Tax=Reichenbachiella sp. MALMAid0571 TaxID=3143939 RepID=UPI0032DF4E85